MRDCSFRKYAGRAVLRANSLTTPHPPSISLPKEILDRSDDRVLVADLARDDAAVSSEVLSQVFDELPRSVRALHLPVGEHIDARQEVGLEYLDAKQGVVHRPVVPVRKVE